MSVHHKWYQSGTVLGGQATVEREALVVVNNKLFSQQFEAKMQEITKKLCEDIKGIIGEALAPLRWEIALLREELKAEEETEISHQVKSATTDFQPSGEEVIENSQLTSSSPKLERRKWSPVCETPDPKKTGFGSLGGNICNDKNGVSGGSGRSHIVGEGQLDRGRNFAKGDFGGGFTGGGQGSFAGQSNGVLVGGRFGNDLNLKGGLFKRGGAGGSGSGGGPGISSGGSSEDGSRSGGGLCSVDEWIDDEDGSAGGGDDLNRGLKLRREDMQGRSRYYSGENARFQHTGGARRGLPENFVGDRTWWYLRLDSMLKSGNQRNLETSTTLEKKVEILDYGGRGNIVNHYVDESADYCAKGKEQLGPRAFKCEGKIHNNFIKVADAMSTGPFQTKPNYSNQVQESTYFNSQLKSKANSSSINSTQTSKHNTFDFHSLTVPNGLRPKTFLAIIQHIFNTHFINHLFSTLLLASQPILTIHNLIPNFSPQCSPIFSKLAEGQAKRQTYGFKGDNKWDIDHRGQCLELSANYYPP